MTREQIEQWLLPNAKGSLAQWTWLNEYWSHHLIEAVESLLAESADEPLVVAAGTGDGEGGR